MDKKIGKLIKVVKALTQLALEIGTLIAVIKMIIESNIIKLVVEVVWLLIVVVGLFLILF